MSELKYPVITITREYSAYGRTVARGVSERLGIPYYDRDFIKAAAAESGFTEDEVREEGEGMSKAARFWNTVLNNAAPFSSSYDSIFEAECKVILKLAANPCIIIGRCADDVLKKAEINRFSIYLYADTDVRNKRAAELEENAGRTEDEIKRIVKKTDIMRATYYKEYTGNEIGDYKNYNLMLDIGKIGVEQCIDIICSIVAGN